MIYLKNKNNIEKSLSLLHLKEKGWYFNEQDNCLQKVYHCDNIDNNKVYISFLFYLSDVYWHHPIIKWNQKMLMVQMKTNDFNYPSTRDLKFICHFEKLIEKYGNLK